MAMIVALLLVLFGAAVGDTTSNCNAVKFEACQKRFSGDLQIDPSYNWHDPTGLGVQIQNIYINGLPGSTEKGIVSVCTAYNDFLDCLNDNAFTAASCFDPQFLISADSTPAAAYQYSFLMSMQQYQCGSGFYPAVENWDCLQKVYQSKNTTIQGCIKTFQVNVMNDALNACNYVQKGMDCFRGAATTCSATLQYYACESFRQYSIPYQPLCKQQCVV